MIIDSAATVSIRSSAGRRSTPGLRRRLAIILTAALASLTVATAFPAPAAAATSADMASLTLALMNNDRAARGLVRYRAWGSLASLAQERAQRMADTHTLSHDAAGGNIGSILSARGIQWYGFGEIIGASGYPWGAESVNNIYGLWKGSPLHRSLMFSTTYNYAGVGVARASDGTTFMSVVFTESKDHTRPVAAKRYLTRSGTTIYFGWSGRDPRLQTHTAGLRSFDVQYRVDGGAWRTIRNDTTATSLRLGSRARGHTYSFRVQAADRRGNLSAWTSVARIRVP